MHKVVIRYSKELDEYRVPSPDGTDEGAYYTTWIDDAEGTARRMYREHYPISISFVRVP